MSDEKGLVQIIDFDRIANDPRSTEITGTARDLVRDMHGNPLPWMHNVHAQPDDEVPAFLIGRGWSATPARRKIIAESGISAMAINDFPKRGPKPRYFVCGDGPAYYGQRIWRDADIMKFCPIRASETLCPREDAYAPKYTPRDAPNTFFHNQVTNEVDPENWLHKPWINWGATIAGEHVPAVFHDKGAARSSMLLGIRLLWHLGYRIIYMVGCDCAQHPASQYWPAILDYLGKLAPTFERYGLKVIQTNPDAHLRHFPIVPFEEVMA